MSMSSQLSRTSSTSTKKAFRQDGARSHSHSLLTSPQSSSVQGAAGAARGRSRGRPARPPGAAASTRGRRCARSAPPRARPAAARRTPCTAKQGRTAPPRPRRRARPQGRRPRGRQRSHPGLQPQPPRCAPWLPAALLLQHLQPHPPLLLTRRRRLRARCGLPRARLRPPLRLSRSAGR